MKDKAAKALRQLYDNQVSGGGQKRLYWGFYRIPLSTGREWDKETGLYYYRARYYDPMEGRFISKDPISFAGGDVNLYGYVQNNPINARDSYGLAMSDVPGAVVTAVSGAVNAISNIATNGPPAAQATLALAGATVVAPLATVVGPEATGAFAPALTTFVYKMATMSPGKPTLSTLKGMCGF